MFGGAGSSFEKEEEEIFQHDHNFLKFSGIMTFDRNFSKIMTFREEIMIVWELSRLADNYFPKIMTF